MPVAIAIGPALSRFTRTRMSVSFVLRKTVAVRAGRRSRSTIAAQVQPLRSLGAYHVGKAYRGAEPLPASSPFRLDVGATNLDPFPADGMLLGCFGKPGKSGQSGRPTHALVVNLDEGEHILADFQGSSRELLGLLLGEMTRRITLSDLSGIPKLVIAEAGNFPEIARFYFDEVVLRGRRIVQAVLLRGMEAGEFRRVDLDHAWRVVIAPVLMGILWKHTFLPLDPAGFSFDQHLQSHLDLLFEGLLRPKDER